jgi:hypothetical protein
MLVNVQELGVFNSRATSFLSVLIESDLTIDIEVQDTIVGFISLDIWRE